MTTRDLSQLRAHVRDFHPRLSARSNADLSARHHREHYRYAIRDHIHTGPDSPIVNVGNDVIKLMRPEGWVTGGAPWRAPCTTGICGTRSPATARS